MENNNQEIWTELQSRDRFRPKSPSEDVIRFFMKNFKRDNTEKILDMGCGAGRHIVLAAESGLIPYGIDFSESGVSYTKELLTHIGFSNFSDNIIQGSVSDLPYEDAFFDGIICWGVLYYLSLADITRSIQELYRVLKTGGMAYIVVRNIEDYRYIDAKVHNDKEFENRSYVLKGNNDEKKSSMAENNLTTHFFEIDEIKELFKDFTELDINIASETHENMKYKDSNFLITVTK